MFEELGSQTLLLLGVIFILFFLAFRKAMEVVKNAVMITIAAIVFPFFSSLLGFEVASDVNSILFYITFGLSLYFVYLIGKSVHAMLTYAEKKGKKHIPDKIHPSQKKTGKKEEKPQKKKEIEKTEIKQDKSKFVSKKTLKSIKEEDYFVYGKKEEE